MSEEQKRHPETGIPYKLEPYGMVSKRSKKQSRFKRFWNNIKRSLKEFQSQDKGQSL